MAPTKLFVEDIKKLYSNYRNDTNNFTEINAETLVENPRYVLLLRLMLKLSQIGFTKEFKISDTNLSKYELGKIPHMRYLTAKRYTNFFLNNIKGIPSEIEVVKTFQRFKEESFGWFKANKHTRKALSAMRKGAANSLKKQQTCQESKVSQFLKIKNIDHEVNYLLDAKHGMIVDLYVKQRQPIIIECKNLKTKIRREVRDQVQRLAFQGYKIKFHHKNCLIVALIESNYLNSRDIDELSQPFDKVFTNTQKLYSFLLRTCISQ